jgi:integrase
MTGKSASKVQPSQQDRWVKNPKRAPGLRYEHRSHAHAVEKSAVKARVPHRHPNQLRHTFGTEVRRALGLEVAQVLLGHSRTDVTQVYAERDLNLASTVAAKNRLISHHISGGSQPHHWCGTLRAKQTEIVVVAMSEKIIFG